jgi:hypothetical protein
VGRIATWAAVLAVALVVGAAGLDSIRSDGGGSDRAARTPTAAPTTTESPDHRSLVRQLVSIGARGRLVTTDARCAVHAYALPSVRETARPAALDPACSFSLSPDGRRAASSGAEWSPDGRFVAVCRGTTVGVWVGREHGEPAQTWDGCTPAWRPDGVLTLVRDGALREVRRACTNAPCERVLLGRAELLRAAAQYPNTSDAPGALPLPEVEDIVWLSRSRVAALLGVRVPGRPVRDLVAVFAGRRLVGTSPEPDDHLFALERSRLSGYLAAAPDRVYRRDGRRIGLPPVPVRAIAVSPDESLIAVAVQARVLVYPLDLLARGGMPSPAELPLVARDLAWR